MKMKRKRKIMFHKIALSILIALLGVALFSLIGLLMTSEIISAEARTPLYLECDEQCKERAELIKQEEEARKAAEKAEKIANARGIIYLTFDDGPGDYTNTLLDVLDKYEVKATFFVTGYGDDAVIKREFDEGHTVALHSLSHQYAHIYANLDNYFGDLAGVSDRVKNITGVESKILRFPGGSSNTVSRRYDRKTRIMSTLTREVGARGYHYFDWNVDSDDAGKANSPDAVYNNVISRLKDGENVVLQHDIKPYSVEAVERIIQYGNENNFVFEPITMDTPVVHHSVNN